MPNVFVYEGAVLERLTVGKLIQGGVEIPLDTPMSYRNFGSLYLCHCSCGNVKAYPLALLEKGTYKSCGCLRKERSDGKAQTKLAKEKQRQEKAQLTRELKDLQLALFTAKNYHNHKEIERLAPFIRSCVAKLQRLKYVRLPK